MDLVNQANAIVWPEYDSGALSNGNPAHHERVFRTAFRTSVCDISSLADSSKCIFSLRVEIGNRASKVALERSKSKVKARRPYTDDKQCEARRLRGSHHAYHIGHLSAKKARSINEARLVFSDWLTVVSTWANEQFEDGSHEIAEDPANLHNGGGN